ncbi:hypothetical protein FF021_18265 [Leptospira noguchii]|nr:hypothetical protein FF021_18265 [Leptospira noguchii]
MGFTTTGEHNLQKFVTSDPNYKLEFVSKFQRILRNHSLEIFNKCSSSYKLSCIWEFANFRAVQFL